VHKSASRVTEIVMVSLLVGVSVEASAVTLRDIVSLAKQHGFVHLIRRLKDIILARNNSKFICI
jgi:hypothetical protein